MTSVRMFPSSTMANMGRSILHFGSNVPMANIVRSLGLDTFAGRAVVPGGWPARQ